MIIAAILWEKTLLSIDYMLVDSETFENIITPHQKIVGHDTDSIDISIENIFQEIKENSKGSKVFVQYKSVIRRYRKSTETSIHFHNALTDAINNAGYKSSRVSSKLKGDNLKKFKKLIDKLNITKKNSESYEYHLWCIALHATKATFLNQIKKIWKHKNGVKTMNVEAKKSYGDFIKITGND